jgi:hypothetical protein
MKKELKHLIEEYTALEHEVQDLVSTQCGPICELCTVACCCRADICEEALGSPFLRLLHGRNELESDAYGFLTENGCALKTGRPPICYEFFCDELMATQPDELRRNLLRILGRLPTYAGQNAHGNAHLVEIMQAEELDRLSFQRLKNQCEKAFEALACIHGILSGQINPEEICRFTYILE